LLKTTLLGDDEDRPLTKADGTWTYFAPDIAYHLQKIERGFDYLICVLGADHDSYKRRLKIAVKLLNEKIKYEIPIVQMVSFEHDGKHVKFSKREGNAIRTHDFIKEIHPDILRYMMLSKTEGTPFIFDYENACSLSMQNPVFYIQYANARAHTIFRNTQEEAKLNQNAHTFEIEEFQNIIILLDSFKFNLDESAKLLAPHIIANYAYKLAENLHKLWQLGKIDKTLRIIIEDNKIETQTRLLIVKCFLNVLETCLEILAINAPQTMN
jgi:arginyl-tRNA synthetase